MASPAVRRARAAATRTTLRWAAVPPRLPRSVRRSRSLHGCDGPTRPVLLSPVSTARPTCPFFRRLAADDGSNACGHSVRREAVATNRFRGLWRDSPDRNGPRLAVGTAISVGLSRHRRHIELPSLGRPGKGEPVTEQRKYPDMWVDPEDDPRDDRRAAASASGRWCWATCGHYRMTLEMKCEGLDAEQLARGRCRRRRCRCSGWFGTWRRSSTRWFRRVIAGPAGPAAALPDRGGPRPRLQRRGRPTATVVEDAWASWRREVAARRGVRRRGAVDSTSRATATAHARGARRGRAPVEEYARHCGHADLLRECIDGRTGQ